MSHLQDTFKMTDCTHDLSTSATLVMLPKPRQQPKSQQEPKVDIKPELLQNAAKDLAEEGVLIKSYKHYLQRKFIT